MTAPVVNLFGSPRLSAALSVAFVAYDDTSLETLWKINVGSGFSAAPMTFEAGGKQYVAIMSGLSQIFQAQVHPHTRTARNAQPDNAFVFSL